MVGNGPRHKNSTDLSASRSFADQFAWHLDNGTRPATGKRLSGEAWGVSDFAAAVGDTEGRNVRNWKRGRALPSPAFIGAIERELFGVPKKGSKHFRWRAELRAAFDRETAERDKVGQSSEASKVSDLASV
jgi:hypothetical protein